MVLMHSEGRTGQRRCTAYHICFLYEACRVREELVFDTIPDYDLISDDGHDEIWIPSFMQQYMKAVYSITREGGVFDQLNISFGMGLL